MWLIFFILLVALAIGSLVLGAIRARRVKVWEDDRTGAASLSAGIGLAIVFGLIAWLIWPNSASAVDEDEVRELTIDLASFDACPDGVSVDEPTFYVRGTGILSPMSVTTPLPENDPDGLITTLYGEDGLACNDPVVAVAMCMTQPGLLPFTEQGDLDTIQQWIALFARDGDAWLSYNSECVKRFDGITWEPAWEPEDGDASFLVADAAEGEILPRLVQREEGLPNPVGAYEFLRTYGDSAMLKELALVADFGWLALPEGLFSRTPVVELDEPLFPPETTTTTSQDQQDQGEGRDDSGGGSGNTEGSGGGNNADQHNGDQSGCDGSCGDGSTESGNGNGVGTGGGSGGGSDCSGSCGSDTGGGDDCSSDCGGSGGNGGGECTTGCGGSSTTSSPATTSPPTTSPPTTRPPTTTTTAPPTTTSPPTTKAPDPGCKTPGFCD